MSKRSTRMLAVIAGAALALGSMAPAIAQRDDDDVTTTAPPSTQQLECLQGLVPDLLPATVTVDPGDETQVDDEPETSILDILLGGPDGDTDDTQLGIVGENFLTYGVLDSVGYVLSGAANTADCLLDPVLDCLSMLDLTPVQVTVDPFDEDNDAENSIVDVAVGNPDPDLVDTNLGIDTDGFPIYLNDTNVGPFVACVLGLLDLTEIEVLGCLSMLDLTPVQVTVDPFDEDNDAENSIVDVAVGNPDPVPFFDTNLGLDTDGFPIYLNDNNVTVVAFCLLGQLDGLNPLGGAGLGGGLLSSATGLTGLGGGLLSPVTNLTGGGSPLSLVSGVVDLATGLVFNGPLNSILNPGSAGASADIFASVAAVL